MILPKLIFTDIFHVCMASVGRNELIIVRDQLATILLTIFKFQVSLKYVPDYPINKNLSLG